MNTKNYIQLSSLVAVILLSAPASASTTIYDNAATASNINMLTNTFLSYTHNGTTLSELFIHKKLYGTMTRIDEYGDDGTTTKINHIDNKDSTLFIKNVWADVKHINEEAHYKHTASKRSRFNVVALGATTKALDLKYGAIDFGTFAGYINSGVAHIDSDGAFGGIFAHYNLRNIDATILTDIGSLNNHSDDTNFNNSWTNVSTDVNARFNIDKTFIVRPGLSIAYTFVSSDDLYVDNKIVWSNSFNFWNIAPYLQFIKEVVPNWYGSLSVKYIAHFGGDKDIHIAHNRYDGIEMNDYTEIGMNVEYNFRQFIFDGQLHKQIGGFDGWSGNINVKYMF